MLNTFSSLEERLYVTLPIKDLMEPLTGFTKPPLGIVKESKKPNIKKWISITLGISTLLGFIIYFIK